MATLTETRTFEIVTCGKCGIDFAMPVRYVEELRDTHKEFFCPNGHNRYYPGESDEEKAKRLLKEEQRKHSQTQFELMAERNAHDATQKKLSKTQKRVKGGVCPCCNRQFIQLTRHMKTQHSEYSNAD